ncbi:recombinase family protein [Gleimia sp. 6138-11-ORH1]|uniref:recombinase family protein n=1 Tax=Gleimia sp. 6138-11-ORH1 TaxID=2973937 RepID=UPI0037C18F6F
MVDSIFADHIGGKSSQRIANSLNNAGVCTAQAKNFTTKTIAKILENRAYFG